ncbi:glycosyltransferase family 8 protein [Cylindrobasidium torrendii FP15055 ss-10]|uniref:Glycosyltransferase family 8 protein n=1 Tax=Cylindrobasidium torrendii FP15055 ss-10 TaxID=1314674 RepID=A0A0D7BJU6_9AGAR|nr:glycosyltransferase family 8 protein [Cylindrobasidium torrendii FP15055 ss-10]
MKAWVALLSKASYLAGFLVVDHSLKAVGSKYPLVAMATETLEDDARRVLRCRGIRVINIGSIRPGSRCEAFDKADGRFADTWTKLRTFELEEYERVVMLDADMVVRRNMDELMEMELANGEIAAAHVCACNPRKRPQYPPDWIPANCPHTAVPTAHSPPPAYSPSSSPRPYAQLNSGLVVLTPSRALAAAILARLSGTRHYYFPDQDLLAEHFHGRWRALPWYYNALRTLRAIHPSMWEDEEVRCVHYILADKPWMERGNKGDVADVLNEWWWDMFQELGESMCLSDPEGWDIVRGTVAWEE